MKLREKTHLDAYKAQITASLDLESVQGNAFALSTRDGSVLHYVIGDLINDEDWNVRVDDEDGDDTVFDVIKRLHCTGQGNRVRHDLQLNLSGALSKVVSKFFDPVHGAAAGLSLEWRDCATAKTPTLVLQATYASLMRRVFVLHNLQPRTSITWAWMRDAAGEVLHLVVSCPGIVLHSLKFLRALSADERTILLTGTQHIYGRGPLPIRELVSSPLQLIQDERHVAEAMASRRYDGNGSLIISFSHHGGRRCTNSTRRQRCAAHIARLVTAGPPLWG